MARATVSCSHPHRVAVELNFDNSGWHIDNTRLIDGIAGFVEQSSECTVRKSLPQVKEFLAL